MFWIRVASVFPSLALLAAGGRRYKKTNAWYLSWESSPPDIHTSTCFLDEVVCFWLRSHWERLKLLLSFPLELHSLISQSPGETAVVFNVATRRSVNLLSASMIAQQHPRVYTTEGKENSDQHPTKPSSCCLAVCHKLVNSCTGKC